jgi:DNA-damage-inducible protein J
MNTPTQVRIDSEIKKQASELFKTLGLDMSSAINLFLHQCILRGGIPFSVEVPQYNKETIEAMKEAKAIANNPNIKGYDSIEELKKSLMED